ILRERTWVDVDLFLGMISISGIADRAISPVLLGLLLEHPCAAAGVFEKKTKKDRRNGAVRKP
ncbi:MAG: hypothetical protein ACK5E0_14615, partial [Bradyrhizobium sp.]|uniref:hypothetical protein n=1 Tax=Bradyrhizobium sp. TaxID=376 RepID=UPI00391BC5F5